MRQLLTILLGSVFWFPAAVGAVGGESEPSDGAWLGQVAAAVAEADEGGRYILTDLYAEWCVWCKVLEEKVFSTPQFRDYAQKFVLLRVDTEDGAEGTRLQARFGVTALPTLLILDHNLVKVGEVQGYAPTERYIQNIELEIALFRRLEERYAEVLLSLDLESAATLVEEFHDRRDGARAATLYEKLLAAGKLPPDETAWTRYYYADALRLDRRFREAHESLTRSHELAMQQGEESLVELLDLLRYEIAQDQGDCEKARLALESFLDSHPQSPFRGDAKRALESLAEGKGSVCT